MRLFTFDALSSDSPNNVGFDIIGGGFGVDTVNEIRYGVTGLYTVLTKFLPQTTEFYLGGRSLSSTLTALTRIQSWMSGGHPTGEVQLDTNGRIALLIDGTAVQYSSPVAGTNSFHLESHVILAQSGSVEIKLDEKTVLTYSGDTRGNHVYNYIDSISYYGYNGMGGNTPFYHFTNVTINDTTGLIDNAWSGPVLRFKKRINGNGSVIQMNRFPDDGEYNYEDVYEDYPDRDGTYVWTDSTGVTDEYTLENLEDPKGVITAVEARAWIRKDSTKKAQIGIILNNVHYWSDEFDLGTDYKEYMWRWNKNPETNAIWGIDIVNTLQICVRSV